MAKQNGETDIGGQQRVFQQTGWTQILQARDGSTTTAKNAMGHLIDLYWKPVYFHIRRKGHDVEDAKDLAQQYFLLFMERGALLSVDPAKGKFRTFILATLDHFLCDEYDRRKAKKRQPNLDFSTAEPQFHEDNNFERDWATVVLDRAFVRLQQLAPREAKVVEAQRTGKTSYQALADDMGTTEANVKVMAHRGRSKLRSLILEELKETVSQPGEEQEELAALFRAFSL
jgi:RNA polymerase sigma factor (sigma-70 family)